MGRQAPGFRLVPFPRLQRQLIDWLSLAEGQHAMHALLQIDVTDARQAIRRHRSRTGEPLSLTAFVVGCFARAVGEDPSVQAVRAGRSRLVLFDDVDVAVAIEHDLEGAKIPVPHVIRAANRKTASQITREIRATQAEAAPYAAAVRWLPAWLLVPGPVRRFVWARFLADPRRRRRLTGTTFVTAVGMFGGGIGWGLPSTINYPIGLTLGSVARQPGVVSAEGGERVEIREFLAVTVSMDHDVIDGAPAARFLARLRELIEGCDGLAGGADGTPAAGS